MMYFKQILAISCSLKKNNIMGIIKLPIRIIRI